MKLQVERASPTSQLSVRPLLAAICISVFGGPVGVTPVFASVPSEPRARGVKPVAEWVLKTGAPTVIRGHILRAMDLEDTDVAVKQRAFRKTGELLTHVCAVSIGPDDGELIFFSLVDERDGTAVVWRTSSAGEVVSTVLFAGGVATRVPDVQFRDEFAREKMYFFEKMRARNTASASGGSSRKAAHAFRQKRLLAAVHPFVLRQSPLVWPRTAHGPGSAHRLCLARLPVSCLSAVNDQEIRKTGFDLDDLTEQPPVYDAAAFE